MPVESRSITGESNPAMSPAQEAWQRLTNKREAQYALNKIQSNEDFAIRSETLVERRTDLSRAHVEFLRDWQREVYFKTTGVAVEERHFMKPMLEAVAMTGDYTIEELRQDVRRLLRNAEGV